jgi:ectoine hydroxylase-related dioxygenase (phytanoyl-CoA dioxygenase family)
MTIKISDEQRAQFEVEGYFILENMIPQTHMEGLRDECQRFIELADAEMDRQGVNVIGLNHRNSRYFMAFASKESQKVRDFLYSDLMAELCKATLGENSYLFFDQYVVKCAEKGMNFSWHQDSGYVGFPHKPYLTCWCTLDDVSEENGTVYILPYDRAGTRECLEHVKDPETNDMVGYFGTDPGIPVIVPAGSIAVFSSTVFHRSGPNTTLNQRRIFLAQYSCEVILNENGVAKFHSTPFVIDGENVGKDATGQLDAGNAGLLS